MDLKQESCSALQGRPYRGKALEMNLKKDADSP